MQTTSHFTTVTTGFNESELVELARAGMTTGLVEYIYQLLPVRAARLAHTFLVNSGSRLDVEDIVQEGILEVLGEVWTAVSLRSPVGWLLTAAQHRMLHYCKENCSSIRVPHSSQFRGARVPWVDSLDAPIPGTDSLTLADLVADVA